MTVAKVIEISSASPESFEHAIKNGVARATKTVKNVKGVWIKEQSVTLKDGEIDQFRVDMKVTFLLDE